jgi:hypothetical protein
MYLVNFPALQNLQQQFIATDRFRTAQSLLGVKNGSNFIFRVLGTDKFTHNLPFLSIHVYFNGVRLTLLDDFTISESGGSGTGYDTVILEVAPRIKDKVFADYVVVSA